MSAYICSPNHFAALAAFANSPADSSIIYDFRDDPELSPVAKCAVELAKENIRSVQARYSDSDDLPGPCMTTEEILAETARLADHYICNGPTLSTVDILAMCSGYDYQSCETGDYESTKAKQQINWIVSKAHRRLPGYENAIRDYDGERDPDTNAVLLMG